ncbi:MAG TPA: MFS transporter [Solirubrobacteraceae bacterium]|nr:MFS transporter [Solirubrobacteraceae bacterium]
MARWRNAIIVAFALGGITVASWGPRMPTIRAELGVSTGTIGVLVACSTVGSIFGLMAARFALHRLGGRGAVLSALLVTAAALALMGVGVNSRSVATVAAGFTIVGFGVGTLDVSINVEGAAAERAAGRTLLPLMHAGWSAGAAIGAAIGALCAAAGVDPGAQFLLLAALVVIVGLVMSRDIPADAPEEAEPQEAVSRKLKLRRWLSGWTDRRLLLIGLVLLGVEFGEGSANNWLSLAVKQDHGQSAAIAALFMTLFAVSEALTRTVAGPLVDRFGRVRMLRYTTALGVAGVALFVLAHVIWLVGIGVVLWAIGVSMGFPLGMSAAAEGEDPATQVSVAASIGYQASLIGPPVIGFLAESAGLLSSLWVLAFLFLAAFAAAGSLRPRPSGAVG